MLRLSLALGLDPRIIEAWPATLFIEFQEFERLEPFGSRRDNWHSATIAYILAMVNRDRKHPAPKFSDFMWKDHETAALESDKMALQFFRAMKKAAPDGEPGKVHRKARSADG